MNIALLAELIGLFALAGFAIYAWHKMTEAEFELTHATVVIRSLVDQNTDLGSQLRTLNASVTELSATNRNLLISLELLDKELEATRIALVKAQLGLVKAQLGGTVIDHATQSEIDDQVAALSVASYR